MLEFQQSHKAQIQAHLNTLEGAFLPDLFGDLDHPQLQNTTSEQLSVYQRELEKRAKQIQQAQEKSRETEAKN